MANKPKPWVAINIINNEVIGRFETEKDAAIACLGMASVDISYRPRAKRRSRSFP